MGTQNAHAEQATELTTFSSSAGRPSSVGNDENSSVGSAARESADIDDSKPTYDEAVEQSVTPTAGAASPPQPSVRNTEAVEALTVPTDGSLYIFPEHLHLRICNQIYQSEWNIPVKPDGELDVCMKAATLLAKMPHFETDDGCSTFLKSTVPFCFEKLMTAQATYTTWGEVLQKQIYELCKTFIELAIALIESAKDDILRIVAEKLQMLFDITESFHWKNSEKPPQKVDGPQFAFYKEHKHYTSWNRFGWAVDFVNHFFELGMDVVQDRLATPKDGVDLTGQTVAALIKPFEKCGELLTPLAVQRLEPVVQITLNFIGELKVLDMVGKEYEAIAETTQTLKKLYDNDKSVALLQHIEDFRLGVAEKLMSSKTFNGKMNGIREVGRLCGEASSSAPTDWLNSKRMVAWLRDKNVLPNILQGQLHIREYVTGMEEIVKFLVLNHELQNDELSSIWDAQIGQYIEVVRNVQTMLGQLAIYFTADHLHHLLGCFKRSWAELSAGSAGAKTMADMLKFITNLAKDDREGGMALEVCRLLWNLVGDETTSKETEPLALKAIDEILTDTSSSDVPLDKVTWMWTCVEAIQHDTDVVPALALIELLAESCSPYAQYRESVRKTTLKKLGGECDLAQLLARSCRNCCRKSSEIVARTDRSVARDHSSLVERSVGKYSHTEALNQHLTLLKYLLKADVIVLNAEVCSVMWELLNKPVLPTDLTILFEWFGGLVQGRDKLIEPDVQRAFLCTMFPESMDPATLQKPAFVFFQGLFVAVNEAEQKVAVVRRGSKLPAITMKDTDLLGLDYLWRVALETVDTAIADMSINLLKGVFEHRPEGNPLLFVDECFKRLRPRSSTSSGGAVRTVERCLLLVENHVQASEEKMIGSVHPRIEVPHGLACRGNPITLLIKHDQTPENPNLWFKLDVHTHTTVAVVRAAIAQHKGCPEERVRIKYKGTIVKKWQLPLCVLGIYENATMEFTLGQLYINTWNFQPVQYIPSFGTLDTNEDPILSEDEGELPGRLLAHNAEYNALLSDYADSPDPKIRMRARALLRQLPTAPLVLRKFSVACTVPSDAAVGDAPQLEGTNASVAGSTDDALEDLANIFDLKGTSAYRLSYRLQALTNLLVPGSRGFTAHVREVRRGFIRMGGLQSLFAILKWNPRSEEGDHEAYLDVLMTVLHLINQFIDVQVVQEVDHSLAPGRSNSVETLDFALPERVSGENETQSSPNPNAADVTLGDSDATQEFANVAEHVEEPKACSACFVDDAVQIGLLVEQAFEATDLATVVLDLYNLAWSGSMGDIDRGVLSLEDLARADSATGEEASPGAIEIMLKALSLMKQFLLRDPKLGCHIAGHPFLQKSVVDMLVVCHEETARVEFAKLYLDLAESDEVHAASSAEPGARVLVELLLNTDLPFWGLARTAGSPVQGQCLQFFKLCAILVPTAYPGGPAASAAGEKSLKDLVTGEIDWILSLASPDVDEPQDSSLQTLITGHMIYLKALLAGCSCEDKESIGRKVLEAMVSQHLFPASRRMQGLETSGFVPICDDQETRMATLAMVVELCSDCPANVAAVANMLNECHNSEAETRGKWDFEPMLTPRSGSGYVGLQNAGATCYMNSVMQQIFANPQTRSFIFSLDDDDEKEYMEYARAKAEKEAAEKAEKEATAKEVAEKEGMKTSTSSCSAGSGSTSAASADGAVVKAKDPAAADDEVEHSMFYQMQRIFGALSGSRMQFFKPEGVWNTYRDVSNQKVDLRKHEDAVEFFQNLTDKLDAHLARAGRPKGLEKTYQGVLADQKICRGECDCYNETTEPFLNLGADVRNNSNLHEALDQMVQGDELSGENAYHCAKHDIKVTALKRTCIKKLPKVMVVQLKRFEHDWENDRPVKVNDRFEFPMDIDMEPWTVSGLARRDASRSHGSAATPEGGAEPEPGSTEASLGESEPGDQQAEVGGCLDSAATMYRLAGVVVHMGTATAGHYYSFIRERDDDGKPGGALWHQFNDKEVTPWVRTDAEMENQFFGGKYTPKYGNIYQKVERNWSAYILFYERVDDSEDEIDSSGSATAGSLPKGGDSNSQPGSSGLTTAETPMEVETSLLPKPGSDVPDSIQRVVLEDNVSFMHRRDVLSPVYFGFVHQFLQAQTDTTDDAAIQSVARLATTFVFNTYLHSKETLRSSCEICPVLEEFFARHVSACDWFVGQLGNGTAWLRSLLLECKQSEIRRSTMGIVFKAFRTISNRDSPGSTEAILFERDAAFQLFNLLDTGAVEMADRATELFMLYSRYVDLGETQRAICLEFGLFERGLAFLGLDVSLSTDPIADSVSGSGEEAATKLSDAANPDAPPLPPKRWIRRTWNQNQQRPLRWLRAALFKLVRACDLSGHEDEGLRAMRPNPYALSQLPLSEDLQRVIFGEPLGTVFVSEIVLPSLSGSPLSVEDTYALCCCCSWNSTSYSHALYGGLSQLMQQPARDLKPLFGLLQRLLAVGDDLQQARVNRAVCDAEDGLLVVIEKFKAEHAKRAYLMVKALVALSQVNSNVAIVLAESAAWKGTVEWLRSKLRIEMRAYRSNDGDDDFYNDNRSVRRTASAEQTLEDALDITEPDAPEDDAAVETEAGLPAATAMGAESSV
jgi:ubiquitin carboxyl-terminal hydrolase 9/24